MEESEEIKQFRFMTYLNLSLVARKIGNIKFCEKYIKKAEAMIKNLFENPSTDPLLVSSYICKSRLTVVSREARLYTTKE